MIGCDGISIGWLSAYPTLTLIQCPSLKQFVLSWFLFSILLTGVHILFTEDSYRAHEPDPGGPATALPVSVFKNLRIASRVELVVVPLTIQEARITSLPLPPNIPNDDLHSPPFASN